MKRRVSMMRFQPDTKLLLKILQFVNGKLVEHKILSQFASISAGDETKLIEMYATFDFCSTSTSICQRCSIFRCRKKKHIFFRGNGRLRQSFPVASMRQGKLARGRRGTYEQFGTLTFGGLKTYIVVVLNLN
jgi:hypothetical protein